ncbi:MAG TPA: hypothetical protein VG099_22500 [Gemmataceae bacterium]|nr:hypothetical protein [Gemmataceae bacterium]
MEAARHAVPVRLVFAVKSRYPEIEILQEGAATRAVKNPRALRRLFVVMIERSFIAGDGGTPAGLTPVDGSPSAPGPPLEVRVTRLEDAVAHLQDTSQLEERVVERVSSRLKESAATNQAATGFTAHAARHAATPDATTHADNHFLWRLRPAWFVTEAYAEARAIIHMYLDRRYRLSWQGKVIPLVLLFFFATSWFWIPFTSVLPWFIVSPINKTIELILAFLLIKFLSREASRYRAFLADLSAAAQP